MLSKLFRVVLLFLLTLCAWLSAESASADCTYTITGQVVVRGDHPFGDVRNLPLRDIEIVVAGKRIATFLRWRTVHTDDQGRFQLQINKSCHRRHVRVRARIRSDDLKVINRGDDEWTVLMETSSKTRDRTFNLGTIAFEDRSGSPEYQDQGNYRRALMWWAGKTMIDGLAAHPDPYVAFDHRISIKYPANVSTSYANGITRRTYISPRGWRIDTIFHELMHLWNYQHNSGTTNWLAAVIDDRSTHGCVENANVAFHEGWAEFAGNQLQYELLGGYFTNNDYTRYWQDGPPEQRDLEGKCPRDGETEWEDFENFELENATDIEGSDFGVELSLMQLVRPFYSTVMVPDTTCPPDPDPTPTVFDLMHVFQEDAAAGWSSEWQVGNRDYGIWRFYERAADILPQLSDTTTGHMKQALDPSTDTDPEDFCTCAPPPREPPSFTCPAPSVYDRSASRRDMSRESAAERHVEESREDPEVAAEREAARERELSDDHEGSRVPETWEDDTPVDERESEELADSIPEEDREVDDPVDEEDVWSEDPGQPLREPIEDPEPGELDDDAGVDGGDDAGDDDAGDDAGGDTGGDSGGDAGMDTGADTMMETDQETPLPSPEPGCSCNVASDRAPTSAWLMVCGIAGLLFRRRRRR